MTDRDLSQFRLEEGEYQEVRGSHYETPKELWGFRCPADSRKPKVVARLFLEANADTLGLDEFPLGYRTTKWSIGGRHVIFDQHYGKRIHRAYVTVHMNRRNEIYLVKNRAVPVRFLREHVKEVLGLPHDREVNDAYRKALKSARRDGGKLRLLQAESVWYPVGDVLRPAFKFRIRATPTDRAPHARHQWLIYIDADTKEILSRRDNLARADGWAHIFDPNPVVALGCWKCLLKNGKPREDEAIPARAYRTVKLRDLGKSGVLGGKHSRVNTSRTKARVRRPQHDFTNIKSGDARFGEVMAYYHVDSAIRYVESLGYRDDLAVFKKPLPVNARAWTNDNSQYQNFYAPYEGVLEFGYGGIDDAADGETILHEFGHALQDKICTDFGQSAQGNAIGEGFGDYFAASFFEAKKKGPAKLLVPTVMSWDGITLHDRDHPSGPPCVRRVDNKLTYKNFRSSANAHRNGKIWSATLWQIRNELGRRVADRIIIESHFQLDAYTTFARGARAIIDADRNLADAGIIERAHTNTLKRIFRRRGIGPVD